MASENPSLCGCPETIIKRVALTRALAPETRVPPGGCAPAEPPKLGETYAPPRLHCTGRADARLA
jgi:hypothetical protein